MNALEVRTMVDAMVPALRQAIVAAAAPLLARIEALEAREPLQGPPGKDGADGHCVDPDIVERLIQVQVEKAVAELPPPERGEPGPAGQDGRDADLEYIKEFIVARVAALPPAEPGEPGKDGAPGRDGADADPEAVKGMVLKLVSEAVAAIPPAEDGQDGAPGRDGRDGQPGPSGPPGRDGIDGKDGLPGTNGRDGLSAEEMSATSPDGGRTLVITLARGGEVISQNTIVTSLPIDRGVWKDGQYAAGDGVSLGGEFWIARRDTKSRPVYSSSSDWRLAVKKGRDGQDGHDGKPGEPGPEGKPGRDLTQLGADGKKW